MGLAPLYGIGPRSDVGRQTEAKSKSGEVFSRVEVGWRRSDGGGGTAETDEKRRKNFILEPAELKRQLYLRPRYSIL